MEERKDFMVHELGNSARSKKEVYDILTVKGGYYLPPIELANSDYISDILSGEKLAVKCKDVIPRRIPQIKGLRTHDIIKFVQTKVNLDRYLPSISMNMQYDRKWLVNIINSLIPDPFNDFVSEALNNREETYIKKQSIKMNVKPEFVDLFRTAGSISRGTGKFYHYIKSSKSRREKKQQKIIEIRDEEIEKKISQQKTEKIEELERRLSSFEEMKLELDDYQDKLHKLYLKGIINEVGNIMTEKLPSADQEESEMRFKVVSVCIFCMKEDIMIICCS